MSSSSPQLTVPFLRLFLVLSAGVIAVSASAILVRSIQQAPKLTIAFWRVTFSLLLLSPFFFFSPQRNDWKRLSSSHRWQLLAAGVCLGLHFWTWISSLSYTSVTASVLLVTTNPLWVGLLSPWIVKERISLRTWGGIFIAMAGTTIVALGGSVGQTQPHPLLGNLLALCGAFAASGYLLFGRNIRAHLDLTSYAFFTLIGAWFVLALGMLFTQTPAFDLPHKDWGLFLLMALLPQLIGHNAMSWSLRYIRADIVSLVLLLEPIGASLLAMLFLSEFPHPSTIGGGALLLFGVFAVLLQPSSKSSK